MTLGMLCNSKFLLWPPGVPQCVLTSQLLSLLPGHTIRPLSQKSPHSRFRNINGTQWAFIPGMHGTYYKHNSLAFTSVSNNNLDLLIYGGMCVETYAMTHT